MAKKTVKKILKALLVGGTGLLAARGLGKRAKSKAVEGTDDAGIHVRPNAFKNYGPYTRKRFDPTTVSPDFSLEPAAKGGRIGAKHGGKVKSMGVAKRGGGVAKR